MRSRQGQAQTHGRNDAERSIHSHHKHLPAKAPGPILIRLEGHRLVVPELDPVGAGRGKIVELAEVDGAAVNSPQFQFVDLVAGKDVMSGSVCPRSSVR